MKYRVTFHPSQKEIEVDEGTKVSDAAKYAGVEIALPCGGNGRCGRCLVSLTDSCGDTVLACKTVIDRDLDVYIPQKDGGKVVAAKDYRKIELEDHTPLSDGYGLAVDIGTTTVALSMVDMEDGLDVYNAADVNGQKILGDDVLARIQYAADGGTDELRKLIVNTINDLADSYEGDGFSKSKIGAVYIAGNTTMEHLFVGVDPTPIRVEPYVPVVTDSILSGKESGLNVAENAKVITMPCISAYVGGDITSDIVFSGMDKSEGISLLIDVGTNGEVALGNSDMMIVCSSSAGPAFEGGNLKSGMMARFGAIDSISIVNDAINYTVIGNTEPNGICGSGIIDLIAQLFKNGYVDKRGNFTDKVELKDGRFIIHEDVGISELEIKDVIMTKAAIYSAARSLVRNIGLEFTDLEHVYIAGGFGNFIDLEAAITMGMLPDVDREKYVYLGNSSLAGARCALLSQKFRDRISEVFGRMTYLDLSSDPVFYDEYMSAQFLPHTETEQFPSVLH